MPVVTQKATHQQTKQHNRDLVLRMIFERDDVSRAEIARLTMLTRTTVSEVVAGLLAEGLVQEVGLGPSSGGKPSTLLRLAADSRYLIGLSLEQEKFIGAVVNLRGEIKETLEVPVHGSDGRQALQRIYCILDDLTQTDLKPLVGMGVGAPGLINTRSGVIINAVNLDWKEMPLARMLEERYGLPVLILNDSQATAIGEFVYGEHASDDNLIVITVKHGIGAGVLINGRLFQGDGGGAGEIGHTVVQAGGALCRCGRLGCLETVASTRAVIQRYQALCALSAPLSLDQLTGKFAAGDPIARQVITEAGCALGHAIGGLVAAMNIHKIVLTGDMTRFGRPWLEIVTQAMSAAALERMTQSTRIELSGLDERAGVLGASAYLLLDSYSLLFNPSSNS